MNTSLLEITYFALPLVIMGFFLKYVFKLDSTLLLPSAIMFVLFVVLTACSPLTPKKFESQLFTLFCILEVVALVVGVVLLAKTQIVWKHFFISLSFQLFYWILLFYYGGIRFTHKFGA
ncbi:hypothetical protein [Cellulophaga baltica]|uniref:hypothetical protein n=1 Tax=Cellulophaga baltica TaxID=76594 RepID=UPI0015F76C74|nr:hypothetical protein [Cellulophaga baltica]MBA6313884.1 hypothetical protein [Cellulophaga baltica]